MRPDVTFADLRSASGNTGNVEENKSLYWNPAIYQVITERSRQRSIRYIVTTLSGEKRRHRPAKFRACGRLVRLGLLRVPQRRRQGLSIRPQNEGQRGQCHLAGSVRLCCALPLRKGRRVSSLRAVQPGSVRIPPHSGMRG